MNELQEKEIKVEDLIYNIRGKEVMLDSDLARLYECTNGTKEINQAVKRNLNKFPERYYFQLSKEEYKDLKSQFVTSNSNTYGGVRKLPYVFTESGVYMLATILKTKVSSEVSMRIIDAFVYMRKYLSNENKSTMLINHEERILKLEESFDKFKPKDLSIIYEGKIYDAYSLMLDIFKEAKEEIIIIDNYVNKELLDILRNIDKTVIIMSCNIDSTLERKYKEQYNNITFINNNPFHDRYIVLDKRKVYVSGMSLKDIGKRYSYINKVNEEIFIKELLKRIENNIKKEALLI